MNFINCNYMLYQVIKLNDYIIPFFCFLLKDFKNVIAFFIPYLKKHVKNCQ